MTADREELHRTLLAEITSGDVPFEARALDVFRYQFAHHLPYRSYAERLGLTPETVREWPDIPAVPAEIFKSDLHLGCFPPEETLRTFLTSGTSGEVKGSHAFRNLQLYEASITAAWQQANFPPLSNAYFTALPPDQTPSSSLAHMFATLAPDDNPDRWLANPDGTIDPTPLQSATKAVVLLGTTLSLLQLCATSEPITLPPDSRVFHTGGFKGLQTEEDPATATAHICTHFGITDTQLIHEYGMTELSSQAYATGSDSPFHCPPWLRVQVIDPATGQPLAPGETGYLVLYDLANLESIMGIRTRDFAVAINASSFHLLGRDPEALPRGCSRASDHFFQSAS